MDTLAELRRANGVRRVEWAGSEEGFPATFAATELAGEVGEACNIVKKLEREKMGAVGSRASVEELAEELADVIICVDLLAQKYNIDLVVAVPAKYNATSAKYGLTTRMET